MSRALLVLAATWFSIACPAAAPNRPTPHADDAPLRTKIARAELPRDVDTLTELAVHGDHHARELALRGLGRIGDKRALDTLVTALRDGDPEIVAAAACAIGVAGSLDDSDLGVTDALLAALPHARASRSDAPDAVVERAALADAVAAPQERERAACVIDALGRAAAAPAQGQLVLALSVPALAEPAAIALARHGRRKIALSSDARAALAEAARSHDPAVAYAAVYAFAREFEPVDQPGIADALLAQLDRADGETRAQAIQALGKRKLVAGARASNGARLDMLLVDRDWRVAVEAIRALGDSDDGKDAIAAAITRRFAALQGGDPTAAHVVIEGEKAIVPGAKRPVVASALASLATGAKTADAIPALTRGWITCLAIAGSVRAMAAPDLGALAQCSADLPDALRLPLVADAIGDGVGTLAARRTALAALVTHKDPRVRAAGLGVLAALWKEGDASDHRDAIATLVAALGSHDAIVAGAAIDAATALYEAIGTGDHALIDAAVVARARTERDPELASAILELIGKRALAAGAEPCRAGLAAHPVTAKAAAGCLKALGEPAGDIAPGKLESPPVDVTQVIGKAIRWHLTTSRGEIVIALAPDVAPWAVATIVTLTRRGYYDGLAFHRVVPNFVVQGGDPTESGAGGPGFMLPAEPSSRLDAPGYVAGGVGIADAGRDSGGSQWFIMHSRAPHLDGRYTQVGHVERGQQAADALLIGDRVIRAVIEM